MSMSTPLTPPPGVLQLALKDQGALHAAYIPWFTQGGIFVATDRALRLGDAVCVQLTLPGEAAHHTIAGTVSWVTPPGAGGARMPGVGVCFPVSPQSAQLKAHIEQMLGAALHSQRPTLTL